jgi:hypothetical protein
MSYLSLPAGLPKLSKATISFWFRVPREVIDAVAADYNSWRDGDAPKHRFMGVVPLITFGPTDLKSREFYFSQRVTGAFPGELNYVWSDGSGAPDCAGAGYDISQQSPPGPFTDGHYSFEQGNGVLAGGDEDLDGSYIGVFCGGEEPILDVSITMPQDNLATFKGTWPVTVSRTWSGPIKEYFKGGLGECPGAPPGRYFTQEGHPLGPGRLCFLETFDTFGTTEHKEGNADVILGRMPETFRTIPFWNPDQGIGDRAQRVTTGAKIAPDQWHHVLISFDFTGPVTTEGQLNSISRNAGSQTGDNPLPPNSTGDRTSSACRMRIALNDEHLGGEKLSVYWPEGYGDDGAILSVNGYYVANDVVDQITETNNPNFACDGIAATQITTADAPSYDFTPDKVDMSQIGIPASEAHVDFIKKVEMAELQIFTDVTVDTYFAKTRQAFIDYPPGVEPKYLSNPDTGEPILDPSTAEPQRNSKGKPIIDSMTGRPVPDMNTAQPKKDPKGMVPAPLSRAASLLKKKPEVLLHMSKNWKIGKNTGSYQDGASVPDDPDNPASGSTFYPGKFEPTGQIKTWKPDPKVGETVGKTVDS